MTGRRRRTAATAALLLAVAACGQTPPSGGTEGTGGTGGTGRAARPAGGEGVVRVVTGSDLTSSGVRQKLIQQAAEKAGVEVDIVELPDDADQQRSQLVAALQAGNKDDYDIVNLDVTWTAEFAEQELIEPLTGELKTLDTTDDDNIWPSVRGTVDYGDKVWAVPWNTDVGLLYYRADLVGDDPSLDTWADLAKMARDFEPAAGEGGEDGDGGQVRVGMVTQLAPYEGLTVNTFEAVWRAGGEVVDSERQVLVAENPAIEGLRELTNAFTDGDTVPLLDKDWGSSNETGAIERFLAGEALTMRNWPFAKRRLEDFKDSSAEGSSAEDGDVPRFGVTALPRATEGPKGTAALGGQNLAITADSPDQEDAAKLIRELTSLEAGRRLYEGGFVPARRDALPSACRDLPNAPPQGALDDAQFERALCWSMEHARARPETPHYAAVTQDIQDVMTEQLREAPARPPGGSGAEPDDLEDRLAASLDGG